jgi:osmotically-inducible protein OsmY
MFGKSAIPDKTLLTKVTQRLARCGVSKLNLTVRNGVVTITGMLNYEAQRRPALSTATAIEGVKSVVDRMTVKPMEKI